MKAIGKFLVIDVKEVISESRNKYLEVRMVDTHFEENDRSSRLKGLGNTIKTFYMGEGIEPNTLYDMDLYIDVYTQSNDIQIMDYKLVKRIQ